MSKALARARVARKSPLRFGDENGHIKKLEAMEKKRDRSKYSMKLSTAERKVLALEAYIQYGTKTAACALLGFTRRAWQGWEERDEDFRLAVDEVVGAVADNLEQEAIRRAYNGSDILLIFLLKGHKPDKYLERQETNINVNSDAIRKFFERAAQEPLGPPAITNNLEGLVVEAE